jgi:hypothetical protein
MKYFLIASVCLLVGLLTLEMLEDRSPSVLSTPPIYGAESTADLPLR